MAARALPTTLVTLATAATVACGLDMSGLEQGGGAGDGGSGLQPDAQAGGSSGEGLDAAPATDSSGADVVSPLDATPETDAPGPSEAGDAPGDATDAPVAVGPPDFAWYKLDETGGDVAHDSTPNHYDVHLQNVTWGTGASFSLHATGPANGGTVTVAAGLRQPPVSFTAWLAPAARSDETSNSYAITPFPPNAVSGDAPGAFGFGIGLDVWTDGSGGSALAAENVGYVYPNVGGAPFVAGVEYFVATTIGSGTGIVYVDGQQVGSASIVVPGATATTTLSLGLHNGDTGYGSKRFYLGRMRDVRVYKRVLTGAEVAALYVAGPAP